jgi:signal transduction histidine kinase
MEIRIEDDGVGFDPESALSENRGLSGMRERAQLVGGTFQVESERGKGTMIQIQLPLQEDRA